MNETITSENYHRPSALHAFFSGGTSGLISGAVMTVIVAAVLTAMPAAMGGMAFLTALSHTGPLMIAASTLFGGIMSAKRAIFDTPAPHSHRNNDTAIVPVPVPAISGPVMAPVMSFADTPEQTSTKSWVAETGRTDGATTRIQQILADGSLSDKDRASAILASRDAANQEASRA